MLRNALMPVVTVLALHLGTLLGGTVLVEYVFNWPGLSGLLVSAVNARDYPEVVGIVLVISILFVALNLAVDMLYGGARPAGAPRHEAAAWPPVVAVAAIALLALRGAAAAAGRPGRAWMSRTVWPARQPAHLLGQDEYRARRAVPPDLGRAHLALAVAFVGRAVACIVGTALGVAGGFLRGVVELLALRSDRRRAVLSAAAAGAAGRHAARARRRAR